MRNDERYRIGAIVCATLVVIAAMVLGDLGDEARARLVTGALSFFVMMLPRRHGEPPRQLEMTYPSDSEPPPSSRRPAPSPVERVLAGCSVYFVADLASLVV